MDFMGGEARIRALVAFAVAFEAVMVAAAIGLGLWLRAILRTEARTEGPKVEVARMGGHESLITIMSNPAQIAPRIQIKRALVRSFVLLAAK